MTQRQAPYKTQRIDEHEEQASFIREVKLVFSFRDDFIPALLFSVPNGMWIGGENKFALMNKYKAEGFRPGVADLIYLQPRGPYAYLCIEMKATDKQTEKGGGLSAEQAEFLEAVNAAGGCGDVCYGAEHALEVFAHYMEQEVRT